MEQWATKEGFFKCPVPRERVTAGELGDVWVHGLTSGQKDDYEDSVIHVKVKSQEVRLTNARAVLMKLTVHNQHGKRLFGDEDIGRLCEVPAAIADPILDVAKRLSGMGADELKDLAKNSEAPAGAKSDCDSGSPKPSDSASAKSASE
jgi:hypothetical protein